MKNGTSLYINFEAKQPNKSVSGHFIHRVGAKSPKLNTVHGHHCRNSDCLFEVNLPFWLSPKTMFPEIYFFNFVIFQNMVQNKMKTSFKIFGCLMPLRVLDENNNCCFEYQ